MPALVRTKMFDYLAHITKENGEVMELTGRTEQVSHNEVYQWLLSRAVELGGYLVSQNISESGDDIPWSCQVGSSEQPPPPMLPAPAKPSPPVVPTVFGDGALFGEYKDTYKGAIPVTYKVTKE